MSASGATDVRGADASREGAPGSTPGLLSQVRSSPVPREEIRFCVVLNGGVSMAIWMGGAVLELDRLTRAGRGLGDEPYRALLDLTGCTARADVIAGTSAGGINGAALAISQVNDLTRLEQLRDVWADQGDLETLLRAPFVGHPTSLLRGDDFQLPQLNAALARLGTPARVRRVDEAPIDLTLTTTVLGGNEHVQVDDLGRRLPQKLTSGRFRWRRLPGGDDPFSDRRLARTIDRLALASRCTAGFPLAFEPCFVPVGSQAHAEPPHGVPLTQEQRLRPDMTDVVEQWGDTGGDRSRYAVDGGALANMPTVDALKAVESMPASGPVRRIVLLVYPHAPQPSARKAATPEVVPTVVEAVSGVVGAWSAQGGRTYVDQLAEHNRRAAGRRGTRSDVLDSLLDEAAPAERLEHLVCAIFPQYRRLRMWRAGRDVADRALLPAQGWNRERARKAAERAQTAWLASEGVLPYVPADAPTAGSADTALDGRWAYGVTVAYGVAEAAADLLRRMVWLLPDGADYTTVRDAREHISTLSREIAAARDLTDEIWTVPPLGGLAPSQSYFALRLANYERVMTGREGEDLDRLVREVARQNAADDPARPALAAAVLETLHSTRAGVAGEVVAGRVREVVDCLSGALPVLRTLADASTGEELRAWRALLAPGHDELPDAAQLLLRLVQLEVAATTLGDEVTSGATLPVEVVQLDAQTRNAFARHSLTGDDKLGGMSLQRFGGFLKRSWRSNDWTWGRVDAATVLCRTALDPRRLRRVARLSGHRTSAAATLEEVMRSCFPDGAPDAPEFAHLHERALEELRIVLETDTDDGDLPPTLESLADLFAWAVQTAAVAAELPELAASILADDTDGASARSYGMRLLSEHGALLGRLEDGTATPADRAAALHVFDRCGVGREPLSQEASSDKVLRVAASAAAVAATVADSRRSGLAAARPVTRLVKGAAVLPYVVVRGLASGGRIGRGLAVIGLALGGALLALALLGLLPTGVAGPAAAVGASALLCALGWSAVRSGTLLHGLVLLSPVVPLTAYAVDAARTDTGRDALASERGVAAFLVVGVLVLGLLALGSLNGPTGTVLAALDRRAAAAGVQAPVRGLLAQVRWAAAALVGRHAGLRLAGALVAVVAVALAGPALEVVRGLVDRWSLLTDVRAWTAVAAVVIAVGGWRAHVVARRLQVLSRLPGDDETGPQWRFGAVEHRAGGVATWAVLYGAAYLGLGLLSAAAPQAWRQQPWFAASVAACALVGAVLTLVVPTLVGRRAEQEVGRAFVKQHERHVRAAVAGDLAGQGARPALVEQMVAARVAYRLLVDLTDDGPVLSARAHRLLREVRHDSPASAHALHVVAQRARPAASRSTSVRHGDAGAGVS